MSVPTTVAEFLELVQKSGVLSNGSPTVSLESLLNGAPSPTNAAETATLLIDRGVLTHFQADQILKGRWRGFSVGKYRILERLGAGGMGVVYLGEHRVMRRRVAIKVLPPSLAQDSWFLDHFFQEAQAIAALDHPNIVRAHDVDQDGKLHFLVMEYVDGSSFQEIVRQHGPMDFARVPHYLRQAALGLEHIHEIGLVHRDIKPSNLLLDRRGVVKILDMGLAHFYAGKLREMFENSDNIKRIVGTDDYLAPEQIVDSDDVDGRADIYSLGATAYFMLTGHAPFQDAALDHHKLIWHLTRRPKPIRTLRPEVPEGLAQLVEHMMAKNPWERPQTPQAVAQELAPWTTLPISPPPEKEMPDLSPAARAVRLGESSLSSTARRMPGRSSWVICSRDPGPPPASGQAPAPKSSPAPAESAAPPNPPEERKPSPRG